MTVYCKISECVFNKELEEPHQRQYGRSYTPIGTTGQYSGKCGRKTFHVKAATVHSSQTKHILPQCDSFTTNAADVAMKKRSLAMENPISSCNEKRCLHFDKKKGCVISSDIYVAWQSVYHLGELSKYPKCDSFSNRGISGHIDFSKSGMR